MCKRAQADNVLNLLEVRQVNDVTINNILIFYQIKQIDLCCLGCEH